MLPKYTPGGFKLECYVEYADDRVVLSFQSNTDDRHYQIEQKPSLLTDEELKHQVAEDTSGKYQSVEVDGQAVFISADTATWTKNGIQFSLKGESESLQHSNRLHRLLVVSYAGLFFLSFLYSLKVI